MPNVTGPRRGGDKVLDAVLMVRLQQLQEQASGPEEFLKQVGVARGTLFKLLRGQANPTLELVQEIAERLGMSPFELLGMRQATAEAELKLHGIDLDQLRRFVSAERKNREALLALTGVTDPKPRKRGRPAKGWT